MVDVSAAFMAHRYWRMLESKDSPVALPLEMPWEPASLVYKDERGTNRTRPVWAQAITNGKIPLGAWVFDVKACGFNEKTLSFVAELRPRVPGAPETEMQAPAKMYDCSLCGKPKPQETFAQGMVVVSPDGKAFKGYGLNGTWGCEECRRSQNLPAIGYFVSVSPNAEGLVTVVEVKTGLWAALAALEA